MNVLQLMISGHIGGIEQLAYNYGLRSSCKNIYVFLWEGGSITDQMQAAGLDTLVLGLKKNTIVAPIIKLCKICKDYEISSIVVQHEAPALRLCALAVSKLMKIQVYTYAHSNAEDICQIKKKRLLWLRKFIFKYTFEKSTGIIAISESVKRSLLSLLKIKPSKIRVIYNGVDIRQFAGPPKQAKQNETVQIIYVGRLIREKGVQESLKALAKLPDTVKYKFTIVGDGSYKDRLMQLIEQLGLSERVEMLGARKDIPDLLKGADIFLHAPVWEEGFGLTIVEAMAAGCVCICYNSGAIPELLENEKSGFLVEKGRLEDLARSVEKVALSLDSEKICYIKKQARQRALKFTIERYVKEMDAVLSLPFTKKTY